MQGDLECAAQSIYRLNQRLTKMSTFMNHLHDTMMSVEDQGEEQDIVNNILSKILFLLFIRPTWNIAGPYAYK